MKLKNMILIVISLSILLIITGSTIIISKFPNIVKDVSLVNVNIDLKSFSISYKWKDCIANFSEVSFNKNIEKNNKYNDMLFEGNVYILTSTSTFSSAMNFAEYIKDNKLG
ncbi:MAG: hypothetical protein ACERKV_11590, partial [Clostridiaceae bacterium]